MLIILHIALSKLVSLRPLLIEKGQKISVKFVIDNEKPNQKKKLSMTFLPKIGAFFDNQDSTKCISIIFLMTVG